MSCPCFSASFDYIKSCTTSIRSGFMVLWRSPALAACPEGLQRSCFTALHHPTGTVVWLIAAQQNRFFRGYS